MPALLFFPHMNGVLPRLGATLRSAKLALVLLLALAAASVRGTLPADAGEPPGAFGGPLFLGLAALLTLNVVLCTARRLRGGALRRLATLPDLALHLSVVLVIAGGASKAALGEILTAVVPVGGETAAGYDWGGKAERPLGFSLRLEALDVGHYPFQALVGVTERSGARKLGLVEVGEGRAPAAAAEAVAVGYEKVDRERQTVTLRVATPAGQGTVALALAPGAGATGDFGGHAFTLVAFRDEVRSVNARLQVARGGGEAASAATLSPNGALTVGGTRVCLTAWGRDGFGNPYAGFQLTRDPGAPLFWAGCILLTLAVPAHFVARSLRRRAS